MKSLAQIPDPDDSVLAPANLAEVRSGKKIELCHLIEAKFALAEIALVLLWIERNFHSPDYSPSRNSNASNAKNGDRGTTKAGTYRPRASGSDFKLLAVHCLPVP